MPVNHTVNIIELKNVSFAYNGETVLENIDLTIHQGDYLGVIGPNGGGKTTLIKLMVGLLRARKGSIKIFGQRIESFKAWNKIGYVAQKINQGEQHFPVTVREVVAMGLVAKLGFMKRLSESDNKLIDETLRDVDMEKYQKRLIGDLSGGQQQRVFMARSLVAKPEVLILDEPTAGVDVKTQERFYRLLKNLNQKMGITLVLISHDIEVIASEATEIACVNKRLVYDNNPQKFLKNQNLKSTYGEGVNFIIHHH